MNDQECWHLLEQNIAEANGNVVFSHKPKFESNFKFDLMISLKFFLSRTMVCVPNVMEIYVIIVKHFAKIEF